MRFDLSGMVLTTTRLCRVRPLGHDPHHAKAACCRKRLVVNPNFPDGLLGRDFFDFAAARGERESQD
jgi:hypothetical protein